MSAATRDVTNKLKGDQSKIFSKLLQATQTGSPETVENLIYTYTIFDYESTDGKALMKAMMDRFEKAVADKTDAEAKEVLDVIMDHYHTQNTCLLFGAARDGDISVFEKMGEHVILLHLDDADPEDGASTLLEVATTAGHTNIVKWITEKTEAVLHRTLAQSATATGAAASAAAPTMLTQYSQTGTQSALPAATTQKQVNSYRAS